MNISFLNPSFLWGLPVASIPILIHLLSRRRPKTLQFSTVRFVQLASTTVVRRFKLKQLILLMLRCLILLLLTLLFSRPIVRRFPLFAQTEGVSRSTVILIDNSYSMGYVEEGESRFSRAKEIVKRIIKMGKRSDRVATFLISDEVKPLVSYLTDDRQMLLEKLEGASLSFRPTNFLPGFAEANEILRESRSPNKEIVLVTDLGANGWREFNEKAPMELESETKLIIIDLNKGDLSNSAISGVDCRRLNGREEIQVQTKIRNYGKVDIDNLPVSIVLEPESEFQVDGRISERVAQGFVNLKAGKEAIKDFFYNFPQKGTYLGRVEVQEDSLPLDDSFYFNIEGLKKIDVLLVDGDPGISSFSSETFYLRLSLLPNSSQLSIAQSPINVRVVTPEELSTEKLDEFLVIFMANVREISSLLKEKLTGFVRAGGAVVFSLGDNVAFEEYNLNFGELLPAKLIEIKGKTKGEKEFKKIGFQDFTHPILQVFAEGKEGDLTKANFSGYFACEVKSSGKVVLGLEDGSALLIEERMAYPEGGKVLLFTSTFDRDWSNLPMKPVFLPLIQQMVRYGATSDLGQEASRIFVAGEEIIYEFSPGDFPQSAEITDPQGRKFSLVPVRGKGLSSIEFGPVEIPGIYKLSYLKNGKWSSEYLSVNLDRESNESDLKKIESKELKKLFPELPIKIVDNLANLEEEILQILYGKEVTKDLTFVLIGLLFLEVFLANSRKKS